MLKTNKLPYEEDAQELLSELMKLFNSDKDSVLHVLSCVSDSEEDVKELLRFIKEESDVTIKTVAVYAYDLLQARSPENA